MKQCQTIQQQFDDRLDQRLGDEQAANFDTHIASCAACRQQWQAHVGLWNVLSKQPAVEPSFGFEQRTLRRLHETPPSVWRWPVLRWAVAGSLLLVCAGGLIVRHQHQSQQIAAYQAIEQDRLEDFDVIASLDQLEGISHL